MTLKPELSQKLNSDYIIEQIEQRIYEKSITKINRNFKQYKFSSLILSLIMLVKSQHRLIRFEKSKIIIQAENEVLIYQLLDIIEPLSLIRFRMSYNSFENYYYFDFHHLVHEIEEIIN